MSLANICMLAARLGGQILPVDKKNLTSKSVDHLVELVQSIKMPEHSLPARSTEPLRTTNILSCNVNIHRIQSCAIVLVYGMVYNFLILLADALIMPLGYTMFSHIPLDSPSCWLIGNRNSKVEMLESPENSQV